MKRNILTHECHCLANLTVIPVLCLEKVNTRTLSNVQEKGVNRALKQGRLAPPRTTACQKWMLLKRGMGNGEWGIENGKWEIENGKLIFFYIKFLTFGINSFSGYYRSPRVIFLRSSPE